MMEPPCGCPRLREKLLEGVDLDVKHATWIELWQKKHFLLSFLRFVIIFIISTSIVLAINIDFTLIMNKAAVW